MAWYCLYSFSPNVRLPWVTDESWWPPLLTMKPAAPTFYPLLCEGISYWELTMGKIPLVTFLDIIMDDAAWPTTDDPTVFWVDPIDCGAAGSPTVLEVDDYWFYWKDWNTLSSCWLKEAVFCWWFLGETPFIIALKLMPLSRFYEVVPPPLKFVTGGAFTFDKDFYPRATCSSWFCKVLLHLDDCRWENWFVVTPDEEAFCSMALPAAPAFIICWAAFCDYII